MSLNQSTRTRLAISDAAYLRFSAAAYQSFQPQGIPPNQFAYRKIVHLLGVDTNDTLREVLRAAVQTIRTYNNNEAVVACSDEARSFITRVRRVAVSWGVQEHHIELAFSVNGPRLLEIGLS